MNGSSILALAEHLSLSPAMTSRHCNAAEVPTAVLAGMKTFAAPTGKHIPMAHLPVGKDKKPGPKRGWFEERLEQARREGAASDEA